MPVSPDTWHVCSLQGTWDVVQQMQLSYLDTARWVQIPPTPQGLVVMQIYESTLILDCIPLSIPQIRFVLDSYLSSEMLR